MTTIAPEVIESLVSFEEIADAARLVAADLDTGRFTLGDIANRCARVYGRDSLGQLATEIRVAKRQTLFEYAKVAARFEVSARAEFVEAGLTFSHFRAAVRAKDDAELWLARAADENWNVAEMARAIAAAIGKPVPPRKVWEGLVGLDVDRNGDRALVYCEEPFTGLVMHATYRAVVYEVAE
jgi:hypothetical protein